MSGGIDSAVAALLLQRQGYPVEGVFMQNWDPRIESERSCEAESDYRCAARVASILRIPLRRVNFVRQYWQNVFERVVGEYSVGGTPNPDVLCNREIKFGSLFQWSQSHGYSHLATGHYARIIAAHGRRFVGQAECIAKDQSYFLADVPSSTLDSVMFPLGDVVSKERVRRLAAEAGLDFLLERPESMGMCFIGKRRRFAEFLLDFVPAKRAEVIDIDTGRVLEQPIAAETIAMSMIYTLGQSVRIGGLPAKMFVVKKCPSSGRLFVSRNRYHQDYQALHHRLHPHHYLGSIPYCGRGASS